MKRFLRLSFLLTLGFCWGAAFPTRAQVTGFNVINVPSSNFALGSQSDLVFELQVSGTANATDTLTQLQYVNNGSALTGGMAPDITNMQLWTQAAVSIFSPGSAILAGVVNASQPDVWTQTFSLPITVGEYLFITTDLVPSGSGVTATTTQFGMINTSVSTYPTLLSSLQYPPFNTSVSNSGVQTINDSASVSSVTDQNIASANLAPGSANNPVLGIKFTVAGGGTALFQDIEVTNGGTAGNNDISRVKVWDQEGGGNFNPATAVYLGSLSFVSPNWTDGGVAYNWNINTGDIIYVTVDISTAGFANNSTCLFTIPSGGLVCTGFANSAAIANPNGQVITAPTDTPTASPTNTPPAPTATFTQTLTPTLTATATYTPVAATPTPTPTVTNTPPAPTSTPTPVVSPTATPVPGAALSLSSNFFTPGQGLTLQVQVAQAGQVKVEIFNLSGERVRMVVNASLTKGSYAYTWDGKNDGGLTVGNGVYFILIQSPSGRQIRKVIVLQ